MPSVRVLVRRSQSSWNRPRCLPLTSSSSRLGRKVHGLALGRDRELRRRPLGRTRLPRTWAWVLCLHLGRRTRQSATPDAAQRPRLPPRHLADFESNGSLAAAGCPLDWGRFSHALGGTSGSGGTHRRCWRVDRAAARLARDAPVNLPLPKRPSDTDRRILRPDSLWAGLRRFGLRVPSDRGCDCRPRMGPANSRDFLASPTASSRPQRCLCANRLHWSASRGRAAAFSSPRMVAGSRSSCCWGDGHRQVWHHKHVRSSTR